MVSCPLRVPSARQTSKSTASLIKCTAPSHISTLTPPGCWLDGGTCIAILVIVPGNPVPPHVGLFGAATWLYRVQQFSPITQLQPYLLVSGVAVVAIMLLQTWNKAFMEV